jgi:hypothetical protein
MSCLDAHKREGTSRSMRRCLAIPSGNKGVREPLSCRFFIQGEPLNKNAAS